MQGKRQYLSITTIIPTIVRIDRGTETDILATMQSYLCEINLEDNVDGTDCIMHDPSTQNKVERWWRELHHHMETFFKHQLTNLMESGHYDTKNEMHSYFF